MKVTLLNHTQNAKHLLVLTKNTRLLHRDIDMVVDTMTDEDIQRELDYMVNTIKSSWEFVDFTFLIQGVSRGFTHQFVRNRLGSYAQQTMRIINMSDFGYVTGPSIKDNPEIQKVYDETMKQISSAYAKMIEMGANIEDARGVLPTNIETNIVAKFNLRALSQMMMSRASNRTQGEYREVLELMYNAVVEAEPWAAKFLHSDKYETLKKIESIIIDQFEGTDKLTHYLKLIDKVRNG